MRGGPRPVPGGSAPRDLHTPAWQPLAPHAEPRHPATHADRFAPLSLAGLKYKLACGSLVFKFESKWVEFYEPALRSSVHVHKLPATEEGVDEADFAANSGALIRNVNASVEDVPFSSVRSTTTRVSLCPLALSRACACLPACRPASGTAAIGQGLTGPTPAACLPCSACHPARGVRLPGQRRCAGGRFGRAEIRP